MKRGSAERDVLVSRVHGRQSPSVVDAKGNSARTNVELEGDDAERLKALRSLRQKHNKPEDWMTGTFHQYDISDVVGAGTFGQVGRDSLRGYLFSCFVASCHADQKAPRCREKALQQYVNFATYNFQYSTLPVHRSSTAVILGCFSGQHTRIYCTPLPRTSWSDPDLISPRPEPYKSDPVGMQSALHNR